MAKQFLLIVTLLGLCLLPRSAAAQKPTDAPKPASASRPAVQKPVAAQKSANTANTTQTPANKTLQSLTQSNPYPITPADSAIHFADSIFRQPVLHYQLVQPDIPADIQSILIRFNNAIVNNREWFQQYRDANAGKPLPYNQRFGISLDEYKRLQNLQQAPAELVPVDTQKITVTREGGYIRFKTDGDIHLLDYLQIDLKKNFVVFGGDTIPLIGHTTTTFVNPYGEWDGYTWRLQKVDATSTLATSRVTARVVEINMGLTLPTPQTSADTNSSTQTPPQSVLAATPQSVLAATPQPQTSQPQSTQSQTSQPQTSQPQTSQPQTSQPQTSQPQTAQPQPTAPQPTPSQSTQPQTSQSQISQSQTSQSLSTRPARRKVFLRLKYQDMRDGETTANLELVGYLLP
jgi:hypothetical protein